MVAVLASWLRCAQAWWQRTVGCERAVEELHRHGGIGAASADGLLRMSGAGALAKERRVRAAHAGAVVEERRVQSRRRSKRGEGGAVPTSYHGGG
jgi:hypothetical protein